MLRSHAKLEAVLAIIEAEDKGKAQVLNTDITAVCRFGRYAVVYAGQARDCQSRKHAIEIITDILVLS